MTGTLAATESWHYAAWVAVDLRLLIFVIVIAALAAVGVCALFVRGRRVIEYAATFIVSFTLAALICLLLFNEVADYPVFVVESVFQFP